jgi:hypothetical protein
MNNEIEILDGGVPDGSTYTATTREGKKLFISTNDFPFFDMLRKMPSYLKIEMLEIDGAEMERYITETKDYLSIKCIILLKTKWHYAETGDPMDLADDSVFQDFFNNTLTLKQQITLLKKRKESIARCNWIIERFSNRQEIYNDKTK